MTDWPMKIFYIKNCFTSSTSQQKFWGILKPLKTGGAKASANKKLLAGQLTFHMRICALSHNRTKELLNHWINLAY
jgi:hypothetical protein